MRALLVAVLALCLGATTAGAYDVTACRARVPQGEVGVLQHDIDCSQIGPDGYFGAIILERNAVLDLNGFTLDHFSVYLLGGVECLGKCEIRGPGRIVSSGLNAGVYSYARNPVTISDVDFAGQITGVLVPYNHTKLRNVTIAATGTGIEADRLDVDGVTVQLGPSGTACVATNSKSASVRGTNLTLLGCGLGIGYDGKVALTNLTVTGARSYGVFVKKNLHLADSSLTGSPIDIVSRKRPAVVNTVCDSSAVWDGGVTGGNFGICAND